MKIIQHVMVATVLSCGLVGAANASVFLGVNVGMPAPVMAVPVVPAPPAYPVAAAAYPPPVYSPPLPAYAAPVYTPAVPVGYIAAPGWYGHPYHPWHVGFGYWHH